MKVLQLCLNFICEKNLDIARVYENIEWLKASHTKNNLQTVKTNKKHQNSFRLNQWLCQHQWRDFHP